MSTHQTLVCCRDVGLVPQGVAKLNVTPCIIGSHGVLARSLISPQIGDELLPMTLALPL